MKRLFFNVAGPCVPGSHYMIDASRRLGKEVHALIDDAQYFVIHAARQSGKTTLLQDLVRNLHGGDYYALYCSLESVQGIIDPHDGIPAIVRGIGYALENFALPEAATFF
ncbi:hypothetical protein FACS1894139_15420 [Planctomycetales bacterium]|nr:hypothetical protein FACS1894108_13180 [Planctomycetales bacterium]GHT07325.1 hypothetical protein FACS1894139_15420 [Planctomycetales bacterium]